MPSTQTIPLAIRRVALACSCASQLTSRRPCSTSTTFVWREAERVIGQPLGLEVDEGELLAAIDRMYRRAA